MRQKDTGDFPGGTASQEERKEYQGIASAYQVSL
jgi:hypothetical protein